MQLNKKHLLEAIICKMEYLELLFKLKKEKIISEEEECFLIRNQYNMGEKQFIEKLGFYHCTDIIKEICDNKDLIDKKLDKYTLNFLSVCLHNNKERMFSMKWYNDRVKKNK